MSLDRMQRAKRWLDRWSDRVLWVYVGALVVALVGGWIDLWGMTWAWWVGLGGLGVILMISGLLIRWVSQE